MDLIRSFLRGLDPGTRTSHPPPDDDVDVGTTAELVTIRRHRAATLYEKTHRIEYMDGETGEATFHVPGPDCSTHFHQPYEADDGVRYYYQKVAGSERWKTHTDELAFGTQEACQVVLSNVRQFVPDGVRKITVRAEYTEEIPLGELRPYHRVVEEGDSA